MIVLKSNQFWRYSKATQDGTTRKLTKLDFGEPNAMAILYRSGSGAKSPASLTGFLPKPGEFSGGPCGHLHGVQALITIQAILGSMFIVVLKSFVAKHYSTLTWPKLHSYQAHR